MKVGDLVEVKHTASTMNWAGKTGVITGNATKSLTDLFEVLLLDESHTSLFYATELKVINESES
jgi:hypothetical protein